MSEEEVLNRLQQQANLLTAETLEVISHKNAEIDSLQSEIDDLNARLDSAEADTKYWYDRSRSCEGCGGCDIRLLKMDHKKEIIALTKVFLETLESNKKK